MKAVLVKLFFTRRMRALMALVCFSLTAPICHASRISGTYVGHGPHFAEMLQLTQTDNGQISGVLSSVEARPDGNISSDQKPLTGSVDSDQLTLNIGSFLARTNLAGTVSGNTIRLQMTDSKGNITSAVFVRGTAVEFKRYADAVKSEGERIVLSIKLQNGAQEFRQTIQQAEKWISNAELHAQRITRVKDTYENIEHRMQSLIDRERAVLDAVARSQISVEVGQGDIAGDQTDIQVDQIWDFAITDAGTDIQRTFAHWDGNCQRSEEFRRRGATADSIRSWESACKETLLKRAKFEPVFKRIMDQRAALKSFQITAQRHRKALVDESTRIE
jgi:hypothetical protein